MTANFPFNSLQGSGPRTSTKEVLFPSRVSRAAAFLKGFVVAFTPRDDHHLENLEVCVDARSDPLAPQRIFVTVVGE